VRIRSGPRQVEATVSAGNNSWTAGKSQELPSRSSVTDLCGKLPEVL